MKKSILFRLFKIGAIPGKLRPVLEKEGMVVFDEGIAGRFITMRVKGPSKRYFHRSEGFTGCLAITKQRVVCFTYGKRQINISVADPKISELYFNAHDENRLSLSFESSLFRDGWEGVIEFRFKTEKALQFCGALKSLHARQGAPTDAAKQGG